MRFPMHIATDMMRWQVKNWWRATSAFPVVLMLEPLHTCNLACLGCSPERYNGDLRDRLSLEQCLEAVDESGAPVVSICGGEPTIYPELSELVEAIIARKRHIYLCTNGILLDRFYKKASRTRGSRSTSISTACARRTTSSSIATGVFDKAIEMIKEGNRLGYPMCTNTTVYRETVDGGDRGDVRAPHRARRRRHASLARLPLRGARGRRTSCTARRSTRSSAASSSSRALPAISSTPLFLQFAAGQRDYPCTPWGNSTRTPKGWKGPCYLIGDKYYPTWKEFWGGVDWDYWEIAPGPALPELPHALGLRAVGRAQARREPARRLDDGEVAVPVVASLASRRARVIDRCLAR